MQNKKGQAVFLGLMLMIVIVILALVFAPVIKETVDTARNDTTETTIGLNCSNPNISDYDKAACVSTDLTMFYFTGALILIGGSILVAKIVLS